MYKKILFFVLTISSCFKIIAAESELILKELLAEGSDNAMRPRQPSPFKDKTLEQLFPELPADINTTILMRCLCGDEDEQSQLGKRYPLVRSLLCYDRFLTQQTSQIEQKRCSAVALLTNLSPLECLQLRDKYKDKRDNDEFAAYQADVINKQKLFSYCAQHPTILKNPLFQQSTDWTQRYNGTGRNCERSPLFWDLLSAIDEGQRDSAAPQIPVSVAENLLKIYGIDLVTLRWSESGMWDGRNTVDHAIDLRNKSLLALLLAHEGLPVCNLQGAWLTNNKGIPNFDYNYLEPLLQKRIDRKYVQQAGRDLISAPIMPNYDYEKMIRFLIKYGFRVNDRVGYLADQQQHHRSLLHVAVLYRNVDACKALIACGADINTRDSEGNTPIDIACNLNALSCIELLKGYYPYLEHNQEGPAEAPSRAPSFAQKLRDRLFFYLFGSGDDSEQ